MSAAAVAMGAPTEWTLLRSGWWSACPSCARLVRAEGGATPHVGTPATGANAGNSGPVRGLFHGSPKGVK